MWSFSKIHTSLFFEIMLKYLHTGIAQLVEHRSPKPGVGSSSLSARATKLFVATPAIYFLLKKC